MKKIASIAAIAAAALTAAVLTVGAAAKDVSLSDLGSSVETFSSEFADVDTKISELSKSRSVKNTLVVAEGEALVIPSGCKLTLKKGCRVEGTLCVENGGYLAVSGGSLEISGSVVNDGTVSVGEKAELSVLSGGELYTSPAGTFKSKTEKVYFNDDVSVACLGKTSVSGCHEQAKNVLISEPVSAVSVYVILDGGVQDKKTLSAEEAVKAVGTEYYLEDTVPPGSATKQLTVLFDNGSAVKLRFLNSQIVGIGGADMRAILRAVK